jgi:membrane protease YdiL (CAAX protease family)
VALNAKQRILVVLFSAVGGWTLGQGYMPAVADLGQRVTAFFPFLYGWEIVFTAPLLALFFWWTLREKSEPNLKVTGSQITDLLTLSWVPILISFIHGCFTNGPSIETLGKDFIGQRELIWIWFACPITEELLFRGWVTDLVRRVFGPKSFTITNPLPAEIWASSIAFSFWHFQNWGTEPGLTVFFQVLYTLGAGFWLGYLRWRLKGIWAPTAGHIAINIANSIF